MGKSLDLYVMTAGFYLRHDTQTGESLCYKIPPILRNHKLVYSLSVVDKEGQFFLLKC